MKISIITVVFNNERTIEDAIKSVLSQTHPDIEYIIVDGKSSDNTNKIIEKYIDKIGKYVSEPDKGIYDAMNKGVSLASGEIIGILNSDDVYQSDDVISSVADQFQENESLNIIYGDLVYVSSSNIDKVVRNWHSTQYHSNFFENGDVPPHPALFVKRKVYQVCGSFNLDYKLAADYDFMLRIFKKFGSSALYIPKLMVRMRLGGATNKSLKNILNGNKEIIRAWRTNGLKVPVMLMPKRFVKRMMQFL